MSRFDRVVDQKNAEAAAAEKRAEAEKREQELELERRKAQYLPIIRKYWQQFKEALPKLDYGYTTTVFSSFLFISHESEKKIKWFRNYNNGDAKYGFDPKGNIYIRGDYSTYHAKIDSIEELIFDCLPWKDYRNLEDMFDNARKWYVAIRQEIVNGNADEAVAKYFESLI